MKPIYHDIAPATGTHIAGICSLLVAPKSWLLQDPVIDFETGEIHQGILLNTGKFWIQIDLIEDSYTFDELPKDSKSGQYIETTLAGVLNYYNPMLQQILQTLRRQQLVAFVTDANNRRRIIGDSDTAMQFQYSHTHKNSPQKEERISVELTFQSEDPAPFYNPDGQQDVLFNLLENTDGNFLLVE